MGNSPRNILVVAPNWLGDAVMSLPLVGLLADAGDVRVRVLASPYTARVFMGVAGVDELIVLDRSGWSRGFARRSRLLRRLDIDAAVILTPSFSSALAVWLAGVPNRIGYRADGRGGLLTRAVPTEGVRDEHLSDNYKVLGSLALQATGIAVPDRSPVPSIRVFGNERRAIAQTLRSSGIGREDYAVVVPGATYGPTKSWPCDRYRVLVRELSREIAVVLAGTAAERGLCEEVRGGERGVFNFAGQTDLGVFFALLEGATLLVANDSGGPHAAASLGVPVVAIFGSTSPRWTRPLGTGVRIVREPVHCSPCFLDRCPTNLECYEGIHPETVLEPALAIIKGGTGGRDIALK